MNPFEIKIPKEPMLTLWIISGCLPAGALMFLVIIATVVKPLAPPLNFELETFSLVFLGQVVVLVPLAYIVPGIVFKTAAKKAFVGVNLQAEIERESKSDSAPKQIEQFMKAFVSQQIIGLALLEGTALFGIIVYMMNQSMICLIGASVLIVLMLLKFPTISQVQNRLADLAREQEIEGERKI